jgi:hypothetical protein
MPEFLAFIKFEKVDLMTPRRQKFRKLVHLKDDFLPVANLMDKQESQLNT